MNIGLFGHFLRKEPCFVTVENLPRIIFILLENLLNSAGNMTADSSSADGASPAILMFLSLNLFLNLCNHSVLTLKGLVSSSVPFSFESPRIVLRLFTVTLCRERVFSFYS